MKKHKHLEFEFGGIVPPFSCGHYSDSFEDTYYLKILFFNFYWTDYNN